jgi:hypothetical protein
MVIRKGIADCIVRHKPDGSFRRGSLISDQYEVRLEARFKTDNNKSRAARVQRTNTFLLCNLEDEA